MQRHAGALQQRAAGEAPLHEAAQVCLLMHVAAAQARTLLKERQRVRRAAHWGRVDVHSTAHTAHQDVTTVPQANTRL